MAWNYIIPHPSTLFPQPSALNPPPSSFRLSLQPSSLSPRSALIPHPSNIKHHTSDYIIPQKKINKIITI